MIIARLQLLMVLVPCRLYYQSSHPHDSNVGGVGGHGGGGGNGNGNGGGGGAPKNGSIRSASTISSRECERNNGHGLVR